jgi:hypothetical protein
MASLKWDRVFYGLPLFGLGLFGFIQACSTNSDKQVTPSVAGSPGVSGQTGAGGDSGAGGDTGTGTGSAGTAGVGDDGSGGSSGAGGSDPTGGSAGTCDGPDCYACTPHTNSQFLNACVPGGCPQHFDNSTLTRLVNGVLPPLP